MAKSKKSKKPNRSAPKQTQPSSSGRASGPTSDPMSRSASADVPGSPAKPASKTQSKPPQSAYAKKRARKKLLTKIAWIVLAVALIGGVVGAFAWRSISERQALGDMTSGSCRYDTKTDPGQSGLHSDTPTFSVNPPSGGIHQPSAAQPGDYSTGTVPPDGQLVHSNEHGYINIWYSPPVSDADLQALRGVQEAYAIDTLLVPRPMDVPYAATTWGKRLLCDQLETDSLLTFVKQYRNKGPERVPH